MDLTTDEALLAETPNDPEAFGIFYRRHENAMLVFFLRRTANAEIAADLTAEVFASALASARRFRPGRQPAAAWLYGIANHKLSTSRRRGLVEDRARRKLGMAPLQLTDDDLARVEDLMDGEAAAGVVARLLAELPTEQREAVRLRVIAEQSYDEIATDLRCSAAVVRQRVSRALRTLRRQLTEDAG
jgi:RNA polymerase sigma-70 factor (ECF subfamily)